MFFGILKLIISELEKIQKLYKKYTIRESKIDKPLIPNKIMPKLK